MKTTLHVIAIAALISGILVPPRTASAQPGPSSLTQLYTETPGSINPLCEKIVYGYSGGCTVTADGRTLSASTTMIAGLGSYAIASYTSPFTSQGTTISSGSGGGVWDRVTFNGGNPALIFSAAIHAFYDVENWGVVSAATERDHSIGLEGVFYNHTIYSGHAADYFSVTTSGVADLTVVNPANAAAPYALAFEVYASAHVGTTGVADFGGGDVWASTWVDPVITLYDADHNDITANYTLTFDPPLPVTATPEPASALLLATGLAALGVATAHRRRKLTRLQRSVKSMAR